jgi:DNA-3-methyladenine glycosylase II
MQTTTALPNAADHSVGSAFLAAIDPAWARLIARIGTCRWRVETTREPYEALVRAIAFQQIHGRAAHAILGRFLDLYPGTAFPAPDSILATESVLMRGAGFSGAKIAAIRAIADAAARGIVPSRTEAALIDDEALIQRMVPIRGVGRWTVEMMLMNTLGRPDILPVDDFGVREGWRLLKGLKQQPAPRELVKAGSALSPHRSVASWYLWRAADEVRELARPVK